MDSGCLSAFGNPASIPPDFDLVSVTSLPPLNTILEDCKSHLYGIHNPPCNLKLNN